MRDRETDTLIIGASVAGLAVAACLSRRGLDHTLVEKEQAVGAPWRKHYERLHLHTSKTLSHLPYLQFNAKVPRYPSRNDVIAYLEQYQTAFNIQPLFNTCATALKREAGAWVTETSQGRIRSKQLVLATGNYNSPNTISFPGIGNYQGKILHSAGYRTGRDFTGQRVLVIGFGNSACEIAIDLYEHGAIPSMSVRSPVNVIPRDIFGIPVLKISLLMSWLPPLVADAISAPLVKLILGDIEKLGLSRKEYGPLQQIRKDQTIPLLDIGTIDHIRKGHIGVYGAISDAGVTSITFSDGKSADFDTVIAAIGYTKNGELLQGIHEELVSDLQLPIRKQAFFGKQGVYACGFWTSPTGQFRQIARDAGKIATDIAERVRSNHKMADQ